MRAGTDPWFTFNVELSCGFVRAAVAGVLSDVGLLCLPHHQDALLAIGDNGDVLGGGDLLPILKPFHISYSLAQLADQLHLVPLHCCVVLQLSGEVGVTLCVGKRTFIMKIRRQRSVSESV